MEVATTTTEATLSAIHESLAKLAVSLDRIAARQENMLVDLKKKTAALAPTATTTSLVMPGKASTQLATKPLSHKVSLDARDPAAPVSPALSAVAPTRCSTLGVDVNGGRNHAALASPAWGNTETALLAPLEPSLDKPPQLYVDLEFNMLTPTTCSVQCCHDSTGVQKSEFMPASSVGSSPTPCLLDGAEFSPTPSVTAVPVDVKINSAVTPLMIDRRADEVFTDVGGSSLFMELELDSAGEVFNDGYIKDVVWDEELADCVITHIGSSSLFLEQIRDTHHELEVEIDKPTPLDHVISGLGLVFFVVPSEEGKHQQLITREMQHGPDHGTLFLPWDQGDWCSVPFEIPPWSLSRFSNKFSPGKCEHQHDLHCENIGCSINREIMQQLCGLARLWDPGISTAVTNVLHPGIFATQGKRAWSYTHCGACQRIKSAELGHLNILQQLACCWAWQPDRFMQEVAVSNLVSFKTGGNLYIFLCQLLNESLQDGHAYLTHDTLEKHAAVSWPHTSESPRLIAWPSFSLQKNAENDKDTKLKQVVHENLLQLVCASKNSLPSHLGAKECQIGLLLLNSVKQDVGSTSSLSVQVVPVFMVAKWKQWESEYCICIKKVVNPVLRPMQIFQYVHGRSLALICWCQMGMVLNCTNSNPEFQVHTSVAIGPGTSADMQLTKEATYFQSQAGNPLVFSSACRCWPIGSSSKAKNDMSWHLQVQEPCKCRNLGPFFAMLSDLEYKQWDPGIGQKLLEYFLKQDQQILTARFQGCSEYLYAAFRLCRAIAWGQAMFLGGGNVITTYVNALGLVTLGLGPTLFGEGWMNRSSASEYIGQRSCTGKGIEQV